MPEPEIRPLYAPVHGVNKRDESIHLDPKQSPYMKNMIVEQTRVRKNLGYSRVGTGNTMTGIGMELLRYVDARGTAHHIALTTSNAYLYNATEDTWDEITPNAADFTGDADDRFSWGVVTDTSVFSNNGGDALMISNGKDKPAFYEGHASDKFQYMTNEPTNFAYTKELVEFWNHLFYINPNDGHDHARGMSVADAGDTSKWNGADVSFDVTLTNVVGTLLRGVALNYDLILYADESITVVRRVGTDVLFLMPTLMYELGLISKRAVHAFPEYHVIIGSDEQFHKYMGATQAPIICDEIAKAFFDELDFSKKDKIVIGHDMGKHKLYFFFPNSSDVYARHYYAWNYDTTPQTMEYGEFFHSVRGFAMLSGGTAWACSSTIFADVKCSDVSIKCSDSYGQVGKQQAMFLSDDGYVFTLGEVFGLHNRTNIECVVDTPDLTWLKGSEFKYGRFLGYSFDAKSIFTGATVTVQYSTDGGATFTDFEDSPVTLTTTWANYSLPCDVVARKCRFRNYQDSSKDLQIRNRAYKIKEGTER